MAVIPGAPGADRHSSAMLTAPTDRRRTVHGPGIAGGGLVRGVVMTRSAAFWVSLPAMCVGAAPALAQDVEEPSAAESAVENAREYWSIKDARERSLRRRGRRPRHDRGVPGARRSPALPVRARGARRQREDRRRRAAGARCQLHAALRGLPVCVKGLGHVPPPAYMIDFDALPETPAGSDAARLYGGPTTADEQVEEEAAPRTPARELDGRSSRGRVSALSRAGA